MASQGTPGSSAQGTAVSNQESVVKNQPAAVQGASTPHADAPPKKKPTSSIVTIASTGFEVKHDNSCNSIMSDHVPTAPPKTAAVGKAKVVAPGTFDVYGTPTYESNADTSSLCELFQNVQFVKLTSVQVNQGDRPDGTIVGVLVLFHRADLKLLQPRVIFQKSYLGVMTPPVALGQFGLKLRNDSDASEHKDANSEQTIASLVNDSNEGQTNSVLLVKMLIFDEKLFTELQQTNYPFPIRSSFEPFTIPELAIRGQNPSPMSNGSPFQPPSPQHSPSSRQAVPVHGKQGPGGSNH